MKKKFEIRMSEERLITPTGMALVGALLEKTKLKKKLCDIRIKDNEAPIISNYDIVAPFIGLLCQGKSNFDAIKEFSVDDFFAYALNIKRLPSEAILRQRMDSMGIKVRDIIQMENAELLKKSEVTITPCYKDLVPLDVDVSVLDKSKTKKEGVSRTYHGFDGYAPIFAYLGEEGFMINEQLREGKTHCQKDTPTFLKETLALAKRVTEKPLLLRLDSGNDSADNIELSFAEQSKCEFIIKRNIRRESKQSWEIIAKMTKGNKTTVDREGKMTHTGSVYAKVKNVEDKVRMVYSICVRTITANGQYLLEPDIDVSIWWTSLTCDEETVINLYKAHGTSEQFHSEIKTDMGVERLPSGKFDTNSLVLDLTMIAYNILRIIGQETFKNSDVPGRKEVKRKRLRTVIQNLIYLASKVVTHARKIYLNLGRSNLWRFTFKRLYESFA